MELWRIDAHKELALAYTQIANAYGYLSVGFELADYRELADKIAMEFLPPEQMLALGYHSIHSANGLIAEILPNLRLANEVEAGVVTDTSTRREYRLYQAIPENLENGSISVSLLAGFVEYGIGEHPITVPDWQAEWEFDDYAIDFRRISYDTDVDGDGRVIGSDELDWLTEQEFRQNPSRQSNLLASPLDSKQEWRTETLAAYREAARRLQQSHDTVSLARIDSGMAPLPTLDIWAHLQAIAFRFRSRLPDAAPTTTARQNLAEQRRSARLESQADAFLFGYTTEGDATYLATTEVRDAKSRKIEVRRLYSTGELTGFTGVWQYANTIDDRRIRRRLVNHFWEYGVNPHSQELTDYLGKPWFK